MFAAGSGHVPTGILSEHTSPDRQTFLFILVLLFITGSLFLLDIVTTQMVLQMGGIELNPFMAGVVTKPALHLCIKAAVLLLIFSVSLIAEQRVKGSSVCFYCVLILLYITVVLNNMLLILPYLEI